MESHTTKEMGSTEKEKTNTNKEMIASVAGRRR